MFVSPYLLDLDHKTMGKGGQHATKADSKQKIVPWSEVEKHTSRDDRWIVIDGEIYNVTNWSQKHPGGSRLIGHYAGQDATVGFQSSIIKIALCELVIPNANKVLF